MKNPPVSSIDLAELVYRGVESEVLDYKAALCWNKMTRAGKAKIIRHCLAMANTRGGCIVIGVGEDAAGHPSDYQGLTDEEVHSFDPSVVGPFINHHVEPPIDFTIERPVVDGKRYAIFLVRPFKGLPHVCSGGVEGELQTGVFYIRTADASSRVAYRAIELHSLIQRALRNQREALGRMLRGILYENRSESESFSDGRSEFAAAVEHAQVFFKRRRNLPEVPSLLFSLSVMPPVYDAELFTLTRLRRAVERAWTMFNTSADFISAEEIAHAYVTNVSLRAFPENKNKMWQLFKSGLFHYIGFVSSPVRKLEYENAVKLFLEAVEFLGSLYTELGMAEELLTIHLECRNAENWQMVVPDAEPGEEFLCRIPEIEITLQRSAADLAAGALRHAERLTAEFSERFNVSEHHLRSLPTLLEQYREKR